MTELWYRIQRRYYKSSVCANGTSKTNGSSDIKQRSKPTVECDTTLEEESHDSADADTSHNHHDSGPGNSSCARAKNPQPKFLTEKPSCRCNTVWSNSEPDTRLPPSDSACSCSSSTVTVTVSPSNTHVSNVEVHSEPDAGRHSTSTLASSSVRLEPVDSGVELRPPDSHSQRSSGSWCVLDIQNCPVSDPDGSVQQKRHSQSSVKCDERTSTYVTLQRSSHEDSRRGSRNSCQNSVRFAAAKVRTENQITSADPALEQTYWDKSVVCGVSRVPKHRVSYNEIYPEPSGPRSHDKKCITMTSSSSSPTVRVSRARERRHGEHRSSHRHSQSHSQSQEKCSVLPQSHHSRSAHTHSQDRHSASAQSRERPSSNSKPRNTHSVPSKSLDVPSHHRDRRSGSSQSRDPDTARPRSKDKHSAPSRSLDVPSHSRDRRSGSSQPRDRDTSQSRSRERSSVSSRSQGAPYHSKDRRSASSQDKESSSSQCEERRSSPVQHRWKDLAEAMRRYREQQAKKENGRHGDADVVEKEKEDQEKLVKIVFSNVCYVMPLRAGLPARQEEHLFDVSDLQHEPPLISKCGSLEVTFCYEAAKCKMTVTIHRAREIPAKDRGGANSTQVRLMMLPTKKQRYKTKVKEGQEPVYEETFVFSKVTPDEVPGMGLRFRLYGLERMRRERMIGESVIGFASLNLDEPTTHWVILEPRSNLSHGDSGFDVSSLSKSDSASSTQSLQHGGMPELLAGLAYNSTTGRLAVQVIKGSNFRNMAMNRAPDTYVKVTLMSPSGQELQRCKTSVRRGQPNPLFKETFMLQVPLFQLPEVTLMVSVYNKKSMKKKEMIGWFSLGQNSSGEEESSHWADMRESKGEEVCRWHVLLES